MYIPEAKVIEPTEVLAGCIFIYENVWENPDQTIAEIESAVGDTTNHLEWLRARELNQEYASKRTNSVLNLSHNARVSESLRLIQNRMFTTTLAAVNSYTRKLGIEEFIYFNEPFNVLKYQTGQEYKAHYDGGTGTRRAVSPILYLNDEYEGGHIEFVHHNVKVKPKPGMLVIFPSNYAYAHIAHPVTDGTKYAIVSWLHDQP
jgi:predicted 2-oxoglutarate/Fe(II)-dependent dioxygenase YbiX